MDFSFLMCSERSGSNLILRMLDSHPEICGPSPTHLIRLLAENLFRFGDLQEDANWRRLLTDASDIMATKLGSWNTDWPAEKLRAEVSERDLGALVRHIYSSEARAQGKQRVFVKENHIYRYLPFLQQAFPGLRIVYQVRDPRDMCLSWKRSPILRGDVVRAANIWNEDQIQGRRLLDCLVHGPQIHHLTYERLVACPERELGRVCAFLGVPWTGNMLDFYCKESDPREAPLTDDWKNLSRPVMSTNFGKYRQGLSREEQTYVEEVCAEVMTRFGYMCEATRGRSRRELETELLPLERQEKPGWKEVPQQEKELRCARVAVVQRLTAPARKSPPAGDSFHA